MIWIYVAERKNISSSENFIKKVLSEYHGVSSPSVLRSKLGKPYLNGSDLFVSLSHTDEKYFLAVATREIGLDAERTDRKTDFQKILKKYSIFQEFLYRWTQAESAVKLLGVALSPSLQNFVFDKESILCGNQKLYLYSTEIQEHFVSLSAFDEITCKNVQIIILS